MDTDNSRSVHFAREFPIRDLPPALAAKDIDEIVKFDPARRVVTFNMGIREFWYELPAERPSAEAEDRTSDKGPRK